MLRLQLLGGLSLLRDGEVVRGAAAQRKALALLAVVAAAPRGISREKLVGYFWPDTPEERGKNSLRQRLFSLRQESGEADLFAEGTDLRLNPAAVSVDLWDFVAAEAAANDERAVESYGGPFLDGVFVNDLPELERWIDEQRANIAARAARILTRVATAAGRRGEHEKAIAAWRRLAAADPAGAAPAAGLMGALADAGETPAALNHFRVYASLLRDEFELEPDARVVAVAEDIRSGSRGGSRSPVTIASGVESSAETIADDRSVPTTAPDYAAAVDSASSVDISRRTNPIQATGRLRSAWLVVLLLAITAIFVSTRDRETAVSSTASAVDSTTDSIVARALRDRTVWVVVSTNVQPPIPLQRAARSVVVSSLQREQRIHVPSANSITAQMRDLRIADQFLSDKDSIASVASIVAHAFVHVDISELAGRFSVSSTLSRLDNGLAVARFTADAKDSTALLPALRALADSTAIAFRAVAGTLKMVRRDRFASPVALRLIEEAAEANRRADFHLAVELARAATRADPGFRTAWTTLVGNLGNAGIRRAERFDAARKAFELRDKGTRTAEAIAAAQWYSIRKEYDSALVGMLAAPAAARAAGTIVNTWAHENNLGNIRSQQREYALAERHYRRAIELNPDKRVGIFHRNLVVALLNQGRRAEADSVLRDIERRDSANTSVMRARTARADATHDHADLASAALLQIADSNTNASQRMEALHHLWATHVMQGAVNESDSLALLIQQRFEALDDNGSALAVVASRSAVLTVVRADTARAKIVLEEGMRRYALERLSFMDRPYAELITAFVRIGDVHRAQNLLTEWTRNMPHEFRKVDAREMADARGEIAVAERRTSEAVQLFRTDRLGWCAACDYLSLARAFDARGQSDSALLYFERYVGTPAYERWKHDALWLPYAYRRLGELYERGGQPAKAADSYERLLALWTNADVELKPTVSAVARRLEGLRAR
jgi:DNA-binding SARP family transcriptional activator